MIGSIIFSFIIFIPFFYSECRRTGRFLIVMGSIIFSFSFIHFFDSECRRIGRCRIMTGSIIFSFIFLIPSVGRLGGA